MQTNKTDKYTTPQLRVIHITIERGFNSSLGGYDPNPDNPGENPITPDTDTDW